MRVISWPVAVGPSYEPLSLRKVIKGISRGERKRIGIPSPTPRVTYMIVPCVRINPAARSLGLRHGANSDPRMGR